MTTHTVWERVEAGGTKVLETLKHLVSEGNIRRVRIRHDQRTVAEFPLTVGVVGAVFAPVLAAIGAITALLTDCSIEVQRQATATASAPSDAAEPPID